MSRISISQYKRIRGAGGMLISLHCRGFNDISQRLEHDLNSVHGPLLFWTVAVTCPTQAPMSLVPDFRARRKAKANISNNGVAKTGIMVAQAAVHVQLRAHWTPHVVRAAGPSARWKEPR